MSTTTNPFQIIPLHEMDKFGRLKDAAKAEYGKLTAAVLSIATKERGIGQAVKEWASSLGCSEGHLRRKLDEWKKTGDWKCLVNKAMAGMEWWDTDSSPLPQAFIDFWWSLCGQNQRQKCRPQHDALLRRWRKWKRGDLTAKIPGYETPPEDCGSGHPVGWSYRTLMRHKPSPVAFTLMTQGISAALKLLPPVPGTRVGIRFLEYVSIDDVWQDRKGMVPGYPMPARLLQMGAMDYASAYYLKFGLRPELPTDEGKRERLKERDAKLLIAMLLETYGYPADYDMHIICERGTATIREADARALYDLSGGRIKVVYTSMEGGLVFAWQETACGNSRGKGWHESWHNLFHNEMATLPGQVGKDNAHQPAALAAQEREARSLTTAAHFLTDEQKTLLRLPFSTLEQAHWETLAVVSRINNRRKHDCEGFETLMEWVLPGVEMEPQPEGALATLDAGLLERVIPKPRKETPHERMVRLSAGVKFNKLPAFIMPRFLDDFHVLRPIENFRYAFTYEGRKYSFKPVRSEDQMPEDGRKYLGYFNPLDPEVIYLTKEDGSFVATWIRERGIQRGDQKAVAKGIAEKQAMLNTSMARVRRVNQPFIEEQDQRLRSNAALVEQAALVAGTMREETCTPQAAALHRATQAGRPEVEDCTEELLREISKP